jgi:hypothetical protein
MRRRVVEVSALNACRAEVKQPRPVTPQRGLRASLGEAVLAKQMAKRDRRAMSHPNR